MSSFVSSWHRQEEQVLFAHFILFITERRVFELFDYQFGQRQPLWCNLTLRIDLVDVDLLADEL